MISRDTRDWSDHALWWEQKQQWLLRTSWTLEKCEIHADASLVFMPQHKPLRWACPTAPPSGCGLILRARGPVFRTVLGICRILNIRHPEELSLLRPLEEKKKKKERDALDEGLRPHRGAPHVSVSGLPVNGMPAHFADSPQTEAVYRMLSVPQPAPTPELISKQYGPPAWDKAHINSRWLDSSRSLLQQGVQENDRLWRRFKYSHFYNLESGKRVNAWGGIRVHRHKYDRSNLNP
ncbi:unnamed protein product [Arctogadus glacialis]